MFRAEAKQVTKGGGGVWVWYERVWGGGGLYWSMITVLGFIVLGSLVWGGVIRA